ncbi:MAG TPA: nuclear transport factor 2 family protein [Solirubrobacteraceae bacterium]|jgi:ketosteroid isomerase-like protein
MYSWLVGRVVRRQFAHLSTGEWRTPFAKFARDAVLRFPGDNPGAGEHRGRDEIAAFFDRTWSAFAMDFTVDAVAVTGPPWDMRALVRWRNVARAADGRAFPNRGMSFIRIRRGRVVEDEIYQDTQVVAEGFAHVERLATAARPTTGTSAPAPAP